jgi:hypothetical protein
MQTVMDTYMREYHGNIFLILDGAAIPQLHAKLYQADSRCESAALYYNTEYVEYISISPCIVKVEVRSPIYDKFSKDNVFADAGVLFGYQEDLSAFKRMMEGKIEAKLPSGDISLFRFYDPFVIELLYKFNEIRLLQELLGDSDFIAWMPDTTCFVDERRTVNIFEKKIV